MKKINSTLSLITIILLLTIVRTTDIERINSKVETKANSKILTTDGTDKVVKDDTPKLSALQMRRLAAAAKKQEEIQQIDGSIQKKSNKIHEEFQIKSSEISKLRDLLGNGSFTLLSKNTESLVEVWTDGIHVIKKVDVNKTPFKSDPVKFFTKISFRKLLLFLIMMNMIMIISKIC